MSYLNKKHSSFLILICWLVYVSAYIGRLNYTASISIILEPLNITKDTAGFVSSLFAMTYGIGQLVNGLLSRWKHYNPRFVVSVALLVSAIANLGIAFTNDIAVINILWPLNGAAQSTLWTCLLKSQGKYLSKSMISTAVLAMSTTVALGTFAAYALTALFNALSLSWHLLFFVAAAVLTLAAVVWFIGMSRIQNMHDDEEEETDKVGKSSDTRTKKLPLRPIIFVSIGLIVIFSIANGFIRDGIQTWTPSLLKDFGVDDSLSIFLTLLLPLLSIFGTALVTWLNRKMHDPLSMNLVFFGISAVMIGGILLVLTTKSVPLILSLFIVVAILMASINSVITSVLPLMARDFIDSGVSAGLLDTFVYVGSALATTLLGSLADGYGWNTVFVCLLAFAIVAVIGGIVAFATAQSRCKIMNWK